MNKSIVVYGPQGCGKTLFAAELMAHLGLRHLVDDAQVTLRAIGENPLDTLFLTNARPDWAAEQDDPRVRDFYTLLQPAGLLYDARLVRRDALEGTFIHPHLPAYEDTSRDEEDITPLVIAQGFEIVTVAPDPEFDALADDYWEHIKAWQPSPPDGDDAWRLAAIVDTEDGARAWYVRPISTPPDRRH